MVTRGRAHEVRIHVADFLGDAGGLHDLAEVLEAEEGGGVREEGVGGIVRPGGCVEPICRRGGVASDEDEFAAGGAEVGDRRCRVPFRGVGGYVVLRENVCEVLVCGGADALALEGDEDCFRGVGGEEGVACLQDGGEVFGAGEAVGEGAVDEIEMFFGWVCGVDGLEAYVQEADALVELRFDVGDLTADRGEGAVMCVRVVRAWYADC